ncbi:HepT-like ribonuclease domain-containing protein [uncultured Muribaculum sp.]|uniref:HepT-like ribonuclease domain-containing protein n=1 Tax=uncultured Muribaculum sp. TaxID=1918613 RepID=UPI0025FE202D|nr:HepT-like ribonuclease domain-containing protein [uncultured Muribaculum sp.]
MSYDNGIIVDALIQIKDAIEQIEIWSEEITSADNYRCTPDGMKTLAATCMLLEAIGESVKKINRHTNNEFLNHACPEIPWKSIMGMRDHIAHGYFDIDDDFVFDVVNNDLDPLKKVIPKLISHLE